MYLTMKTLQDIIAEVVLGISLLVSGCATTTYNNQAPPKEEQKSDDYRLLSEEEAEKIRGSPNKSKSYSTRFDFPEPYFPRRYMVPRK